MKREDNVNEMDDNGPSAWTFFFVVIKIFFMKRKKIISVLVKRVLV